MLISVVVAMKDEEGSLPLLARELDGLCALLDGPRAGVPGDTRGGAPSEAAARLEVVLVDDGSEDETAALAAALCSARVDWRLERHATNRGFGAALRTGVAAARGDVIVSYDADCAYPAADVVRLLDVLASGADVASATPFVAGASADAPGWRLFVSRACSRAYRVALRGRAEGLHTFTCAFRAYRAETLRAAPWRADGFLAAAEILSRCVLSGARVVEIPSTLRPRVAGASKMRVVRTALQHAGLLARLVFARPPARAPTVFGSGAAA